MSEQNEKQIKQVIAALRLKPTENLSLKELAFLHKYDTLLPAEKDRIEEIKYEQKYAEKRKQMEYKKELDKELAEGNTYRPRFVKGGLVEEGRPVAFDDVDTKEVGSLYDDIPSNRLEKILNSAKRTIKKPLFIVTAVIIIAILFIFRSYLVPSESMYPTLMVGDRIIGSAIYFPSTDSVEIGDVVCFYPPMSDTEVYVKRVIAKAGDRVQISGNDIYVNGELSPYGYSGGIMTSMDHIVSEGCLWMAGDNGSVSADSRVWGELPAERLICKVHAVYWPFSRAKLL